MTNIIAYRSDVPSRNDYPRAIISPPTPAACCRTAMARVGPGGIDGRWRFYYKRCAVCGYTVRCFYAPSLLAVLETGREVRIALAEMNLGTDGRKRRTRAQLEADRAMARRGPLRSQRDKLVPSAA
jgi:hypothetical protein